VPPDAHDVGADDSGPKTVKVMVPVGADPSESTLDTDDGAIVLLGRACAGALIVSVGLADPAPTTTPWPVPKVSS
jgi:hypothetical protein